MNNDEDRLTPYTGDNGQCPKCGFDRLRTRYCQSEYTMGVDVAFVCVGFHVPGDFKHEHMHRWCTRCEYKWLESMPDLNEDGYKREAQA